MEISRNRFNRPIVAFVLFVLLALSYVELALVMALPEHDPSLGTQSAFVLLSHEAPKMGTTTGAAPPAPAAIEPTRHAHQP
jgi:hypothetical protein